jgi:hypothetical protein
MGKWWGSGREVEGKVLDARCRPVLDVFLGSILIGREVSLFWK